MRLIWLVCALVMIDPALGVAQDDEERLAITAILDAPEGIREQLRASVHAPDLHVVVTPAELPRASATEAVDRALLEALVAARRAYVSAEFEACLGGLGDDARLHEHLARGDRGLVARALFWRVACRVGAADEAGAAREAARFATFGLEVPIDAEAATPDVEAALADALREVEDAPRSRLRVHAATRAAVSIDGRAPGCQTPCTVDLPGGDHVVRVSADGWVPAWRITRVEGDDSSVDLELAEAPPELAAEQWAARWTGRPGMDSAASVELLARATRARRLVLVRAEPERGGPRLTGVLAIDGRVAARATRAGGSVEDATRELLRDLLVEGGAMEPAPELVESPWLWIAVGLAAAAAAGITAGLLYQPEIRTEVGF